MHVYTFGTVYSLKALKMHFIVPGILMNGSIKGFGVRLLNTQSATLHIMSPTLMKYGCVW